MVIGNDDVYENVCACRDAIYRVSENVIQSPSIYRVSEKINNSEKRRFIVSSVPFLVLQTESETYPEFDHFLVVGKYLLNGNQGVSVDYEVVDAALQS